MQPPEVLLAIDMAPRSLERLKSAYTVHQRTTHDGRLAAAAAHGDAIRALVTNGTTLITADLIGRLPHLSIICAQGVGHEGIDQAAARARGITITHGTGTNADSVADHAMALMLAALRDLVNNDAVVRSGGWRQGDTMRPAAAAKRVGILGLGDIGARIARRCAGFDMTIAYHNRNQVPDSPWAYVPTLPDLAAQSDILVVALPGGASTRHLVDAAVLERLGAGFLVNVGRGTVVDTAALIAALKSGRLAGAALDVIEGEPVVPQELRSLRNVVLTPHMAGRSPESVAATIDLVLRNLAAHFAGQPVLTPIPVLQAASLATSSGDVRTSAS